MNKYSLLSTT